MHNIKQVTEDVTDEDAVFRLNEPLYYLINQVHFAFLYFEVSGFGKVAVPVRMMREGYRALPLLNRNFEAHRRILSARACGLQLTETFTT